MVGNIYMEYEVGRKSGTQFQSSMPYLPFFVNFLSTGKMLNYHYLYKEQWQQKQKQIEMPEQKLVRYMTFSLRY